MKRIFDQFARDAGRELARFAPKADPGRVLPADVWIQNRVAEQRIEKLLLQLHDDLLANFDAHTRAAWEAANKKADAMIADFIRGLPISETARRGMFARNAHAFRSFMQRKEAGMNLSERIWKATESAKENLAYFVASGVAEGRPAALISQDIRALLLEPDRRFHRIRNARGQLVLSRPMRNYHPGAGVYRSSYMNALRVGATETNIAYHEADHERWQRLDFVLGVKVERSGTSAKPCPVCDAMQGTYPKGFKFLPWHPFCICHATPVMLSGEEFTDYLVTGHMPPGRVLRDMPQRALEYVEQHPYYRNSYSYLHNVPFFDPKASNSVKGLLDKLQKPIASQVFVAFDPFSPIIVKKLSELATRKERQKLLKAIIDDKSLIELSRTGEYRTVSHPGHKWGGSRAATLEMARDVNRAGADVAFLPEYKEAVSADAITQINGRYCIADFKYSSSTNANTLSKELVSGFLQANNIVLKVTKMDSGQLREAIEYVKRSGVRYNEMKIINKYGKAIDLSLRDIQTGKYIRKIRGFL